MTDIRHANFPEDLEHVVAILREYVASPSVSLAFQNYEAEFAALPGKYAAPEGCLLLAWKRQTVVGCAALRRVDASTCEMKRVYVRPDARGESLGRRLIERILDEARGAGYSRICLDVLPEFSAAQRIYESLGFQASAPVTFNPVPGTKYLALELSPSRRADAA
ncbi:GNAT family N-acetyltransferase [Polaromonas sp. YR568]|uniref:GNAT family N-acetyltransferase n=1 Tax=Polaromonas sp. YR568 TaxID=1855301 RepID=UPI00398C0418